MGLFLKAEATFFSASVDDISFVDAKGMRTDDTYITSFSKENSYVDANKKLNITILGSGNVYYSIIPTDIINLYEKGEGRIIKK